MIELTDQPDKYLLSKFAESKMRQAHQAKDSAGCLAATAEYEDLIPTEVIGYYGSGCCRAMCAEVIAQDPTIPAADVARLVKEQEDRSLDWLRKALDAGFSSAEQLKNERDLAGVRKREDFQAMVAELENKKK